MRLDELELGTLRVLLDLHQTQNTYKTADRLQLSQSKVVRHLAKARDILDDRLLIRSGNRLEPTSYLKQIVEHIPGLLHSARQALQSDKQLDPLLLEGERVVILNRPLISVYGTRLYKALSQAAPNVTWCLEEWGESSTEKLLQGRACLGLNFFNRFLTKSISQKTIAQDEFILLVNPNHPLVLSPPKTLDNIFHWPLIIWNASNWLDLSAHFDMVVNNLKVEPQISLKTDNFLLAMNACEQSNGVLTASRLMQPEKTTLVSIELPKNWDDVAKGVQDIVVCSAQQNKNNPLNVWIMKIISSITNPSQISN
ncbi:LysR family transcriptional regulator [Agarivorans sp. Alg241-V36]|uniref:LysR family transcriptional regulator n=1 Tax=Agarivorans sp. Alg241-V36 TaxID=2305992 RepID=UPI0013D1886B|nr:LysR family transcriptional regulator [Agarivorans sp. Alg241-V36]